MRDGFGTISYSILQFGKSVLGVPSIVRLAGGTRRSEDKPNTSLVDVVLNRVYVRSHNDDFVRVPYS